MRQVASVDEAPIKKALRDAGATVEEVAAALAEAKAMEVSKRQAGVLVIGADQILECAGTWFDKPANKEQAADQLKTLSGRTHRLVSAVCVVQDQRRLWQHVESPRLTMRRLGKDEVAEYLRMAGPEVLESVGAYRLEGLGARLFAAIEGDYFTILGLPLLPLLAFLRSRDAIDT